jgi:predicted RNA-binding protein with PIN domain
MHFLIDGYNLLYAMGVIRRSMGPHGLEKGRLRLLGLLSGTYGEAEAGRVTVVFDAAGSVPGATEVANYQGIHIQFADRKQQADDLIEFLILHDSAPKTLTVVSDDHRIQQAGRRRHCVVVGCADYLEWLDQHRRQRQRPPIDEGAKPEKVSAAEAQRWLEEFAGLEDDPEVRRLLNLKRFGEEGDGGHSGPAK